MKELRLERVRNGWYIWYMEGLSVHKEVFIEASVLVDRLEQIVAYEMEVTE